MSLNETIKTALEGVYGEGHMSDLLRQWRADQGTWNVAGAWGRDAAAYWEALSGGVDTSFGYLADHTVAIDLGDTDDVTLVSLADVVDGDGGTPLSLREQDDILYDPGDSDPARRWKFYFSVVVDEDGGQQRPYVWAVFSADGVTWGAPVECQMGSPKRSSEDPCAVQTLAQPGVMYRDGADKMYMYVEDSASSDIYVYESTDGVNFTQMANNPVITRGGVGTWDHHLVGSPSCRHDGTNYLLGYEGIDTSPGSTELFGLAYGTEPNDLTKLAANPLWLSSDPAVTDSIVVDSFFLNETGDRIIFLVHDGLGNGGTTMFRGVTANLDPLTWVEGDITSVFANVSTLRNDFTVDHHSDPKRAITTTDTDDEIVTKVVVGPLDIGAWLPTDLTDLEVWLDPSDAATVTAAGGVTSQVADKSGNGRHATAAGGDQPAYGTRTQNGLNVLDSTNDKMTVAYSLTQPFTIAFTFAVDSNGAAMFGTSEGTASIFAQAQSQWKYNAGTTRAGGVYDTRWHTHVLVFDGASSKWYVDGNLDQSQNPGANNSAASIQLFWANNIASADAAMGDFIVLSSAVSDGDRAILESYLGQKWATP